MFAASVRKRRLPTGVTAGCGALAAAVVLVAQAAASGAVLVSDSFDYMPGAYAGESGGTGWATGWRSTLTGSGVANETVAATSLPTPPGYGSLDGTVPAGGSFVGSTGGTAAYRTFARAGVIDLAVDQDYYISFLTRRSGTARSFALNLYAGANATAVLGVGNSTGGALYSAFNGTVYSGSGAVIGNGATPQDAPSYLWVVKVSAKSGDGIDQIAIKTYRGVLSPQTVDYDEPSTWSYVGANTAPVNASGVDRIGFASGSGSVLEFDEFRIGTTFQEVTLAAPVPEPGTAGVGLACGGAALIGRRRRRRRKGS